MAVFSMEETKPTLHCLCLMGCHVEVEADTCGPAPEDMRRTSRLKPAEVPGAL